MFTPASPPPRPPLRFTRALLVLVTALFAARASGVEQAVLRGGVFFEAERFDTRHSGDEEFALIALEKAGSEGSVLYNFFKKGHVNYQFTLPAAASASTVWLRYAAPGDVRIKVAMDAGEKPEFASVEMPGTGGTVGPDVWRWQRIWTGELAAGAHELALGSAAMRLDCIFVTPDLKRKPDDKLLAEAVWLLRSRLPELSHERTITRHPRWLDKHWRVAYGHAEWNRAITVEEWCKKAAEAGANLICAVGEIPAGMLDGKMTRLPKDAKALPEGYQLDYSWVKRNADAAHANGQKYLCYVNAHAALDPLLLEHPEWRQLGASGEPRNSWGCWNSAYRAAFIERLVRIARDSHFDGIMIDMGFVAPPGGCRSRACIEKFHSLFGIGPPVQLRPENPLYQRWIDFQSWTREEWMLELTEALHAVDPEIAVVANQTRGWIFNLSRSSFLSTRVGQCVDGLLEEIGWETQHSWPRPWAWPLQGAWQNLSLRCRARPGSGIMWHLTYNMPEVELLSQGFSMLANGVLPAVTTGGNWPEMSKLWKHIKGCEPWVSGTELEPWLAIHYSENTLAWYADAGGEEKRQAFMKNVFGLFQAAIEAHLPVEIISDDELASAEKLRRYAVVALPNSAALSDAQIAALGDYVEGGGGLMATFQSGMFDEFGAARERPGLEKLLGARQGEAGQGARWVVDIRDLEHPILQNEAVAKSGIWRQGLIEPGKIGALYVGPKRRSVGMVETSRKLAEGTRALLPARGYTTARGTEEGKLPDKGSAYRGLLVSERGKGRVAYTPLDLGYAYFSYGNALGRALLVESFKWAAAAPLPVRVEAPMLVQTVPYRKGDTAIVHLLNDISSFGRAAAPNPEAFTGFRAEVIPIHDIRIGLPGSYGEVRLLPAGTALAVTEEDGVSWVTVPRLEIHAMLVATPKGRK